MEAVQHSSKPPSQKPFVKTANLPVGRSEFNDEITNSPLWGHLYDGRAVMGPIHDKFLSGATLQDCQKLLQEGYSPEESMRLINNWA